ncbi:MAG TPA: head-tail adaptor protein [Chloroflexota bacterium]
MADNRPDPNAVRIGSLRWPVIICTRLQAADPNSTGILETLAETQTVYADIQPIGPMTFYAAEQVDTPVTHRITIRWLNWVDTTCVVFRTTNNPDGTKMTERFRVRRVMPVDGRQRFIRMECELEERKAL